MHTIMAKFRLGNANIIRILLTFSLSDIQDIFRVVFNFQLSICERTFQRKKYERKTLTFAVFSKF